MVSVIIGYQQQTLGTVAETATGLQCAGPQQAEVQTILDGLRTTYAGTSDAELIILLPRLLNNGYYWAHPHLSDDMAVSTKV